MEETSPDWNGNCFICDRRAEATGTHRLTHPSVKENILNMLKPKKDDISTTLYNKLLRVTYLKYHKKCYDDLMKKLKNIDGESRSPSEEFEENFQGVNDSTPSTSTSINNSSQSGECEPPNTTELANNEVILAQNNENIEAEKEPGSQQLNKSSSEKVLFQFKSVLLEGLDGIINKYSDDQKEMERLNDVIQELKEKLKKVEEEKRLMVSERQQRDNQVYDLEKKLKKLKQEQNDKLKKIEKEKTKLTEKLEEIKGEKTKLTEKLKKTEEEKLKLTEKLEKTEEEKTKLTKKLEEIEEEKRCSEEKIIKEQKQRDRAIHNLKVVISKLEQKQNDERIQMSPSGGSGTFTDTVERFSSSGEDNTESSEPKKARLKSAEDAENLLKRIKMLEKDNKIIQQRLEKMEGEISKNV